MRILMYINVKYNFILDDRKNFQFQKGGIWIETLDSSLMKKVHKQVKIKRYVSKVKYPKRNETSLRENIGDFLSHAHYIVGHE